jgi:hypothetical protein
VRRRALLLTALVVTGCNSDTSQLDAESNAPLAPSSWDCQSDEAFFTETAWPRVIGTCAVCHRDGGQSGSTRLVLINDAGAHATNLARLKEAAALKQSGAPLLLLKASAAVSHGGGERAKKGSEEYDILRHLLARFEHPPLCQAGPVQPKPLDAAPALETLSAAETLAYLNAIAPQLVERFASPSEIARVEERKGRAIPEVLESFTEDPRLESAARRLVEKLLSASGSRDGIDFSLPGNLAAHLVRERRPWSELLTSQSCYAANDRKIPCDTGAPFTAGVLTTRAYLSGRASRFNLTRSSTIMAGFACVTYPIADTLQPRIDKRRLIPMFQASTPDEQTDERAQSGFGNGHGCYECHGQFSLHAQLFVKFDRKGIWRADASGLQDEDGELGNSTGDLMASHLLDPAEAKEEHSDLFGAPVENLAEAAAVLASSGVFLPCAARKIIDAAVGTDSSTPMDQALLDRIAGAAKARAKAGEPTFQDLVIATFSDPLIVHSVLKGAL